MQTYNCILSPPILWLYSAHLWLWYIQYFVSLSDSHIKSRSIWIMLSTKIAIIPPFVSLQI